MKNSKKKNNRDGVLLRFEKVLLLALPIVVFFSYTPVISFGSNESMNFELSLPLIWLVIFGVISMFRLPRILTKVDRKIFIGVFILISYITLSVLWSKNPLRGVLTIGIICLIILSILNFWSLKLKKEFLKKMIETYLWTALAVGVFCIWQCVADVFGLEREVTQLCAGCTYNNFGFTHMNGLAIEPQFMGNLLIAPTIISLMSFWKAFVEKGELIWKFLRYIFLSLVLFLTLSRGAIYACFSAIILIMVYLIFKKKVWKALIFIPCIFLTILTGLITQGMLAEISPTTEGFFEGIMRSINQMSLGKIDWRKKVQEEDDEKNKTRFDGYIAESTDIRLNVNEIALKSWLKTPERMLFGVGIGGAGVAMAETEIELSKKEIVQNEYLMILLELGVLGWIIIGITVFYVIKQLRGLVITKGILVAYGLSWCFFSGISNVLHIYLITPVIGEVENKKIYGRLDE